MTASTPNISGISIYIQVDGQLCLAPITAESATLFVGMLPVFQHGQPKEAQLMRLPEEVAKHVAAAGQALARHIESQRAKAQKCQ